MVSVGITVASTIEAGGKTIADTVIAGGQAAGALVHACVHSVIEARADSIAAQWRFVSEFEANTVE